MFANIQSRIGLKQFATGCTISSQCEIVTDSDQLNQNENGYRSTYIRDKTNGFESILEMRQI